MKYRANAAKYAEFTFEVVDPSFYERATTIRDKGRYNIIVAGLSYGQGSSREHAALCPMYLGVRVLLAKSIERIHKANLINFGIVPFTFGNEADYDWIDQGDELEIPDTRHLLQENKKIPVFNKTKNKTLEASVELSEREKEIILAGGTLPYIKETKKNNPT
ncbi:Methanogen homoaconitase small subunit [subsurface metagenome]